MTDLEDVTQPISGTPNLTEDVFTRRFVALLIEQVERDLGLSSIIDTDLEGSQA
ncbi:hypothetical protein KC921_04740 [Candidatus Woesebacteria bacterium]|nr:hypothetical protein [Candidatus Woesebacteria bacterium]